MLETQSLPSFLNDLASQSATPGGGSVTAIMGAMGAALLSMVCHLTIGRPKYSAAEAEIGMALTRATGLRTRLLELIEADMQAFAGVMAGYALPKATTSEQAARREAIQAALKAATEVPLDCARLSLAVMELSRTVAEKGNHNVIADAGVAVLAAYAALRGSALNVWVNARAITAADFTEPRLAELDSLLERGERLQQEIYQLVRERL